MYKLINGPMGEKNFVVVKVEEGWQHCIPKHTDNKEYREYLEWLEAGNTPELEDPTA